MNVWGGVVRAPSCFSSLLIRGFLLLSLVASRRRRRGGPFAQLHLLQLPLALLQRGVALLQGLLTLLLLLQLKVNMEGSSYVIANVNPCRISAGSHPSTKGV